MVSQKYVISAVLKSVQASTKANENSTAPHQINLKPSIWNSVRLTYTICAFFAMVLHLCMRNTLSFAILCMVKSDDKESEVLSSKQNYALESDACPIAAIDFAEFSWTRSQQLQILGCFYYGYFVTLPLAGRLCDKYGGKLYFILSLILQALVFSCTPIVARLGYEAIIVLLVLQGVIAGFGNPSIYQLYTVWAHPSERTALMSFAYGGYSVGALIVFPYTSLLCHIGWPKVFYSIGGIACVFGICCNWLVYSNLESHPRITQEELIYLRPKNDKNQLKQVNRKVPWRSILKSMPFYAFIVAHVCQTYGMIVLTLLMPRFFLEAMRYSLSETGLYAAAPFVGSCFSKLFTVTTCTAIQHKFANRLTLFRRWIFITCNALTILGVAAVINSDCTQRVLVVVLVILIGALTDVAFSGAYWVSIIDCAPPFAGLLSGIANSLATVISSLTPLAISGVLTNGSKTEWNTVFFSMIFVYTLSTVLFGVFGSSELQHWAKNLDEEKIVMEKYVRRESDCNSRSKETKTMQIYSA